MQPQSVTVTNYRQIYAMWLQTVWLFIRKKSAALE